jgi:ABC-type enterochelin transport system ATPase subunit
LTPVSPELIDFILFSDKQENGQVRKVLYSKMPDNFEYERSHIRFVSLIVKFSKDEEYYLKLSSEKEDYFIVNNKFNKLVFLYLIRKQYGVIKNEETANYTIDLIDHDINFVTLSDRDEIIINKDSYIVSKGEKESIIQDYVEVSN